MMGIGQLRRLLHISHVLSRYRLDEINDAMHLFRPMRLIRWIAPWGRRGVADASLGRRLRLALQELGPVFVKFGQMLSTRRDLLPSDIADELALLQDQVEPFPGKEAVDAIETAFKAPWQDHFSAFDPTPLASASVAQVHAATLHSGEEVVVKVLRPGIVDRINDDVRLLRTIAGFAHRYWHEAKNLRPLDVVAEFERTIYGELDLTREAANASQLRRNFADSDQLRIPRMHWDLCFESVMVAERVSGIPIDDIDALRAADVDMEELAARGTRIFYTQVFRDNFFHADMHPGNIMVDASDPKSPIYVAVDFGIVGSMPPDHLHYLGENFLAFFNQDYRRVAELHVEAGWIPNTVNLIEVEAAVRTVCEPQMSRPLSEISFAQVLFQLFAVARRFNLVVQPELILLQKTLLNIEGIARQVYPELDIWATAKPVLVDILRHRFGVDGAARDIRDRLPLWVEKTPQMPGLIFDALERLAQNRISVEYSESPERLRAEEQGRKSLLYAVFATGAALCTTLLVTLNSPGPTLLQLPITGWITGLATLAFGWRALR